MRSVVLDTETTGMPVTEGHRIIEIGCVELQGRRVTKRHFHVYLQPDRTVDEGAVAVHGITNDFLRDKPRFSEVADEFFEFIHGAQLIIHNAAFDIGFINAEFAKLGQTERSDVSLYCTVLDTLLMARERHPGQRNSLDALCKRYGVDNSGRELHGALLDAEILADVYLAMTGGQTDLSLTEQGSSAEPQAQMAFGKHGQHQYPTTCVVRATDEECLAHEERLNALEKASGGLSLWRALDKT